MPLGLHSVKKNPVVEERTAYMSPIPNLKHYIRRLTSLSTASYLDLLEDCLTGTIYKDRPFTVFGALEYDQNIRESGLDWPSVAHTMIGRKRLKQLRLACEGVLVRGIRGDFVEAGVWRGGASILMRGVLAAYRVENRKVWLFDSFSGLPAPSLEFPQDKNSNFHEFDELSVSLEQVKHNFASYKLLDPNVVFVKGWFKDTMPQAQVKKIALLRLDGDLYESTIQGLEQLYPKVSSGGCVIVDDYHVVPQCKQAVHDFLNKECIHPEIQEIDGVGVFWRKRTQR